MLLTMIVTAAVTVPIVSVDQAFWFFTIYNNQYGDAKRRKINENQPLRCFYR